MITTAIKRALPVPLKNRILTIFPALGSHNYQLYFVGQMVSMIGTWLQQVAQGWLVLELTNSAFAVGVVTALLTLPALFLALFGGVLGDKFNKRTIMIITQSLQMILALVLGGLTVLGIVNIYEIGVIALLMGIVNSLDIPTRQAFVVEIVDRKHLQSAIALNAAMFNGARVLGPSLAGFLISFIGTGGAFILNGLSFVAVIVALYFVSFHYIPSKNKQRAVSAIKSGVHYALRHPLIRGILAFTALNCIFGWSYTTLLPVIADQVFHVGAAGLGYEFAAAGLGAISAAVLVSGYGNKVSPFVFVIGGNILFALSIFVFSFVTYFPLALVLLYTSGLGIMAMFSTVNTTLQHLVKDSYRSRVMSLYTMAFMGMMPFGSFQAGYLAEHFGTGFALRVGVVVVLLTGIIIFLIRHKISHLYSQYEIHHDRTKEAAGTSNK